MAGSTKQKSDRRRGKKSGGRDLRLDLFRGLANWAIFLDHIPENLVNWITTRNYGFGDAADIFVFISGYTAAFVYARVMREQGVLPAAARILKRAWQIYVAHVFLFVIYLGEIGYLAARTKNRSFVEQFNLLGFLSEPDVVLTQGLMLKFKPVNMDVLPLYIVLMLVLPPVLFGMLRRPNWTLAASFLLYSLAWWFGWNLPAFPKGEWYFNPFTWQLLFVFAAWCGVGAVQQLARVLHSRVILGLSVAYLLFALVITLGPRLDWFHSPLPSAFYAALDKTNLGPLRFLHFVALAFVTVYFVHDDWPGLRWRLFRPAILCGQHSLEVFCLGIFLSFAGHVVLVEISSAPWTHILVSAAGIGLMIGLAYLLTAYRALDKRMAEFGKAVPMHAAAIDKQS